MDDATPASADRIAAFIGRWEGVTGKEFANFQTFMRELCAVLGLPDAPPGTSDPEQDAYVFERSVTFVHGDGSTSPGRIDFYRRGAFVCEGKKVTPGAQTRAFDDALLHARSQAEGYAGALPPSEGCPPFLLVVDVGRGIELYAEFTRTGATYTPFPDPRSHRIGLGDLLDRLRDRADALGRMLEELWAAMDHGDFSAALAADVLRFNGKLFVKPERAHNRRDSIRTLWWCFGWERPLVRAAIKPLRRYLGTTETAKHRLFQYVRSDVLCDHMVICIAVEDVVLNGVL